MALVLGKGGRSRPARRQRGGKAGAVLEAEMTASEFQPHSGESPAWSGKEGASLGTGSSSCSAEASAGPARGLGNWEHSIQCLPC